jgi:hypothetical protein
MLTLIWEKYVSYYRVIPLRGIYKKIGGKIAEQSKYSKVKHGDILYDQSLDS